MKTRKLQSNTRTRFVNSHVTQAANKQLGKLWHTTNIYYHPKIHEYAEQLTAKLPGDLKASSIDEIDNDI